MAVYLLTFDLSGEDDAERYALLWTELRRRGAQRALEVAWIIDFDATQEGLRDHLKPFLGEDDRLFVAALVKGGLYVHQRERRDERLAGEQSLGLTFREILPICTLTRAARLRKPVSFAEHKPALFVPPRPSTDGSRHHSQLRAVMIIDFEHGRRIVSVESVSAIGATLEAAKVDFIEENGDGPGDGLRRRAD